MTTLLRTISPPAAITKPSSTATGPRTAEGKAVSRFNAVKHGLSAKDVVIFGENPVAFNEFHAGFVVTLAPGSEVETFLVERIAACAWRLRRTVRVERDIFEQYESLKYREHASEPKNLGHAMMIDAGGLAAFSQLSRHEASIERAMYRALHELERLQAARLGAPVPVPQILDVDVVSESAR